MTPARRCQFYLRRDQNDPSQFILEHTVNQNKIVDALLNLDSLYDICSRDDYAILASLLPGTQAVINLALTIPFADEPAPATRPVGPGESKEGGW